jgi:hypothetical protein
MENNEEQDEIFVSPQLGMRIDGNIILIKRYPNHKSDTAIFAIHELEEILEIAHKKMKVSR